MPSFGTESKRHLATLDPQLQRLMNEAIKYVDFTITCGFRNQADQHKAFVEGNSKLDWPNGEHNKNPSRAVDVAPYVNGGIDWNDAEAFTLLAGIIFGIAKMMNIPITLGIDWDGDLNVKEHSFKDRPHIQLR
jgi:peptidoglycan L-alanyl-D-glutamate endopeptidase CwlK